jgi:hypothetical protein
LFPSPILGDGFFLNFNHILLVANFPASHPFTVVITRTQNYYP